MSFNLFRILSVICPESSTIYIVDFAEAAFSIQPQLNLLRIFAVILQTSSELGHAGLKSRSPSQIKGKSYKHC